jgi:hypothetical protein
MVTLIANVYLLSLIRVTNKQMDNYKHMNRQTNKHKKSYATPTKSVCKNMNNKYDDISLPMNTK